MRRKWEQEKFAERSGCQPHTGTGKAGGAIVRIVVVAVTGTFAVMLFVACIAVFRAGECMRAMEKMKRL